MMILRKLTTDKELWDSFVEYIDDSIAKQHKALEQATEVSMMYKLQGSIACLRRMKYLRDELNSNANKIKE
jgi:nitrate/TMAO reductase-like tetraheme cytochrome c subunit|tara:strand:+ start:2861 stop:3073 length:213 start_codon:yes stop_codon:yes gene_type:complete